MTLSYMLPCYRALYSSRLLGELVKKTTLPYELLVWLNLEDQGLEVRIQELIAAGYPIHVVGKTPHNIGMEAFKPMIEQAKGDLLVQLEDDVLFISRRAGEVAQDILMRRPEIGMLSADLWQDEISNGGHPPPSSYTCVDVPDQLYEGPIDGGFSVYPRSSVPFLLDLHFSAYFGMGRDTHYRLRKDKKKGYKCRRMRIFHVSGAAYHSLFPGMVDFEIAKYNGIGHKMMVDALGDQVKRLPAKEVLEQRVKEIERYHESFDGHTGTRPEDLKQYLAADQATGGVGLKCDSHIRACLFNDRIITLPVPPPILGGKSVVLPVRNVSACSRVDILGSCQEPFSILVEEADEAEEIFRETSSFVSVPEEASGLQKIREQIVPSATFMRLTVTNIGILADISMSVNGIPNGNEVAGVRSSIDHGSVHR